MEGLPSKQSSASFWHSEPSEFLLGHRTTPDLPEQADIVIVGSGITGASAARFLAEDERAKGLSVVMLEAREACWGATGRNGGIANRMEIFKLSAAQNGQVDEIEDMFQGFPLLHYVFSSQLIFKSQYERLRLPA